MPTPPNEPPLLVTATLDDASFAILDGLRRRHFPPALNKVPAHVSLFHHLPGEAEARVLADIRARCRGRAPLPLAAVGLRLLGRGVAIAYESADLSALRAELARDWRTWLTPQDQQPFRAHVTIQNKATPEAARALQASLATLDLPDCRIVGVTLWRYLGGPWERVATTPLVAAV